MRNIFLLLFSFFLCTTSSAGKITGTVTDSEGKPLPYASVFVKGTRKGTNANNDGKFVINLEPGQHTLVCQYVGYKREERLITVTEDDLVIDFVLQVQDMMLGEVLLTAGLNPANEIIKKTIEKRAYHQEQLNKFQCEVYTKGQLRVRSYPKKIFGQKVDFQDGDTSQQKMLYLSETISLYSVEKPNKEKIEVLSSRVSGQSNSFGLSAPQFFSVYDNNVFIGENLSPRGFISPISDNATNYYKYKFEGSFFEDGRQINKIRVLPKRKYEPLFYGYINIVEDEWRIHSLQLLLTKESQMQLIDSLRLEQLYHPVTKDVWAISSQVIYPAVKVLGFDAYGSFINIYSNFNIDPKFDDRVFNSTILKYNEGSNRKPTSFWDTIRPIPLQAEEAYDYNRKDSLEFLRKDKRYLDSVEKVRNKVNWFGALLFEQNFVTESKRTSLSFRPITEQVSFNPAEGWVISTAATWTKRLDSNAFSRKGISIAPNLRYGLLNKHFNAHLTLIYSFGNKYARSLSLSGGTRIFQFNNYSPIGPRGNSLSSLLGENNRMKIYEATYFRSSYHQGIGNGFSWTTGFQFQDRRPLENRTDYTWRDQKNKMYTPNYPNDLVSSNIKRHQVFYALFRVNFQPGTRYIEMPDQKMNIGSKYPVFMLEYIQAFDKLFGSDGQFSKWKFTLKDDMNFKLLGVFRYRLGIGGFLNKNKVQIIDYQHFNGNISSFATEYLNSFQLLPLYKFSNTSTFYSLAHIEHNFKGFLTNKLPFIRRLNLHLVAGANIYFINSTNKYSEYFVGIDNIFKQFRIDFVKSNPIGEKGIIDFRIGFRRNLRPRGDDWP